MNRPSLRRLREGDAEVRAAACREIAREPRGTPQLEGLIEALGDSDPGVSRAASDALVSLGERGDEVGPLLHRALRGEPAALRWAAAFSLSRLEPPSLAWVQAASEALGSQDPNVRWAAAKLLVGLGRHHEEARARIVQLLTAGETATVRRMAAFAVRDVAPGQPAALSALVAATSDQDTSVRRAALTSLARVVDPPESVVQHLFEVLRCETTAGTDGRDGTAAGTDGELRCRVLAAIALGELGRAHPGLLPPHVVTALEAAANSGSADAGRASERVSSDLRRAARRALARLAPVAESP